MPYVKEDKDKVHRFISGFLVAYRDQIEFDESILLEEAIKNLKHCYENSKHIFELKCDLEGNEKVKG